MTLLRTLLHILATVFRLRQSVGGHGKNQAYGPRSPQRRLRRIQGRLSRRFLDLCERIKIHSAQARYEKVRCAYFSPSESSTRPRKARLQLGISA